MFNRKSCLPVESTNAVHAAKSRTTTYVACRVCQHQSKSMCRRYQHRHLRLPRYIRSCPSLYQYSLTCSNAPQADPIVSFETDYYQGRTLAVKPRKGKGAAKKPAVKPAKIFATPSISYDYRVAQNHVFLDDQSYYINPMHFPSMAFLYSTHPGLFCLPPVIAHPPLTATGF